jgi:AcrR family transcriptional regulator
MSSTSSAASPRPRGRPRTFDRETTTEVIERTLWANGYLSTSVEQLASATGLSLSSLYAAYGSKLGALDAALERYEAAMGTMFDDLEHGQRGLDDIADLLERVRSVLADERLPRGCFMVNTMVELGGGIESVGQRADAYRARLLRSIRAALIRAADAGEIPADTVEHRARVIQSALFGVLSAARSSSVADTVEGIEALTAEVRGWHRCESRQC